MKPWLVALPVVIVVGSGCWPGSDEDAVAPDGSVDSGCSGVDCPGCDEDGDGYTSVACGGDDCDDDAPDAFPGRVDLCDSEDDDCDGRTDEDVPCDLRVVMTIEGSGEPMGHEVGGIVVIGLQVPDGAIDADAEVTIELADELPTAFPSNCTAIGPTYDFAPHDLVFAQPVTITLPAPGGERDAVLWASGDGGPWLELATAAFDGEVARLETDRLGYFQVATCDGPVVGRTDAGSAAPDASLADGGAGGGGAAPDASTDGGMGANGLNCVEGTGEVLECSIADGDFVEDDWTHMLVLDVGGTSSVSVSPASEGGNPGPHQRGHQDFGQSTIVYAHVRNDVVYDVVTMGAVESLMLSIDFNTVSGSGFCGPVPNDPAASVALLVKQGPRFYVSPATTVNQSSGWVTVTHAELSGFRLVTEAGLDETSSPDFSMDGEALEFGYASSNSSGSACTRDWAADNWSVTVTTTGIGP